MIFFFYSGVCISFIILQTLVIPDFFKLLPCYDLLIPFVIYTSIERPFFEGILVIAVLGIIVDTLSATPMGVYTTIYLWFFVCIRWGIKFLRTDSYMVFAMMTGFGVLMENLIFLGIIYVLEKNLQFPGIVLNTIAGQEIGAFITGPLFLTGIDIFYRKYERSIRKIMAKIRNS